MPPPEGERVNAHVVLVEPLIAGNTGSVARLCAGTRSVLHLVEPLGFDMDDRKVRRAGLDYWPDVWWRRHPSLSAALAGVERERVFMSCARAPRRYSDVSYPEAPWLIFGRETTGLDQEIREEYPDRLFRLPINDAIRSLNLANTATAALFEVLRQRGFPGLV